MSEHHKIEERLRRKEAEILAFEEKIKAARVYAQALRDVLRLLGEDSATVPPEDGTDTVLRAGSAVAQAREAILEKGAPMHVNDILSALGKDMTREARASLIGSISAYVRRGEIFTRPAPNTFGLSELGHPGVVDDDATEEDEPPAGFGRMATRSPDGDDEERDPFYVKDIP
jgi:hypothetical protein